MANDPKSIGSQIDCLARLTGAPDSFVEQVRSLFLTKGLSLEDAVAPYLDALEEAFRREEMIRRSTGRARESLSRLNHQFNRLGDAYRRQIEELKRMRSAASATSSGSGSRGAKSRKRQRLLIATDRPAVVTRTQRDVAILVPGPSDPQ